jgi:hypothetical protein
MNLDFVPIWAMFVGTIAFVLASVEVGYLTGRFAHQRSDDEKESPVSAIAGSVLGLVAFILAFTFSIVYDRYDARKELVRNEANAIATAWMRSDFLPEPDRAEAKGLLREYLRQRLDFTTGKVVGPEEAERLVANAKQIIGRLWEMAVVNARRDMNSDVAALYIDSLNQVNEIGALRVAVALQARIPIAIWFVLFITTSLGMMGVGYQTGIAGSKRSMARPLLAISFALIIALIATLDRPTSGYMRVSQQPQIDLLATMEGEVASQEAP